MSEKVRTPVIPQEVGAGDLFYSESFTGGFPCGKGGCGMGQITTRVDDTLGTALQRWLQLAKDHDVYMELDIGFAGVMGEPDGLPPRLARKLDKWMRGLIGRCRSGEKEDRWLRLKLAQRGSILRMECEAAGSPPEYGGLRAAGAYLESEDMGDSFYLSLEAGLTAQIHDNHTAYKDTNFSGVDGKEDRI